MFKSLREKISQMDVNSQNNPSEQNMSRFSSLSSLVSDVGSAFSKALTNPQLVQPTTRNMNQFYDYESLSEYDDSTVQGDVISKEDLFYRYQRAQSLIKRYKTRALEAMECYKQLEQENMKLTETVRISELRLTESENSLQAIIDQQTETINELELQIVMLKEGNDLPTELELKIKERHDLELLNIKKKDDEIKELRTLTSRYRDSLTEQVDNDSQQVIDLDNINKNHNDRILSMIQEFDQNKSMFKSELRTEFERRLSMTKMELKNSQEQRNLLCLDNERLVEQVHIKTKIIEDLLASQDHESRERQASTVTTFNQLTDDFPFVEDSINEVKVSLSKFKQLELMKLQSQEEVAKMKEVLNMERKNIEKKSLLYEKEIDEIRIELGCTCKELTQKKIEMDGVHQRYAELDLKNKSLELELKKTEKEKYNLLLRLDDVCKHNNVLQQQVNKGRDEYEVRHSSVVDFELTKTNGVLYQQIEEMKGQRQWIDSIMNQKDVKIQELQVLDKEKTQKVMKDIKILKEDIFNVTKQVNDEFIIFRNKTMEMEIDNELLSKYKDELIKLLKDKEDIIINLTNENKIKLKDIAEKAECELEECNVKLRENIEERQDKCVSKCEITQQSGERNVELLKEIDEVKKHILFMEEYKMSYSSLPEDSVLLQNKMNETRKQKINFQHTEDNVLTSTEVTATLERLIDIYKKFLSIFIQWIQKAVSMADCESDYDQYQFWNKYLHNGCINIEEIVLIGHSLGGLLLSWRDKCFELNELKLNHNKQGHIVQLIYDFCSTGTDQVVNNDEMVERLSNIRIDLDVKNAQLIEVETSCKSIENMLLSDDLTMFSSQDNDSLLFGLKQNIINRLVVKDGELNRLQIENEKLVKKLESITNERIEHFKVLAKIFDVTSIDFEQNDFSKLIIRGLKDYAKKSSTLSTDLNDKLAILEQLERQLIVSADKCSTMQSEIDELKKTESEKRSKLLTTCRQLECRLDEFTEEKGRIDEEKQSLRKEMNGLNAKIQELRLDIEKQGIEKQKLEKHFDESLEKVKANHLALEDNYRTEMEKQSDYQHYLEQQISVNRDESTRKLSENVHVSNSKLEEVLNQSEQLLMLNNKYKELLDKSKIETCVALDSLKQSELKFAVFESELQTLRNEKEILMNSAKELDKTLRHVEMERDGLKSDVEFLNKEQEKSMECLLNLQSSNVSYEAEKLKYRKQIEDLEVTNEDLCGVEKMQCDFDDITNQLEEQKTRSKVLESEIVEKMTEIKSCRGEVETMEKKLKDQECHFRFEIAEIKQQFSDDRTNIHYDYKGRIENLAKEFSEKMLEKEKTFQKSLHDAIEKVLSEEAQQKSSLKEEINQQNRMVIELETEKNGLMNTVSDCEEDRKRINTLLQTKELQLQSLHEELVGYKSDIINLERQISELTSLVDVVEQQSKVNQSINTETVNANDYDIQQIHCNDIEEQLKQVYLEDISLKPIISTNIEPCSVCSTREDIILSTNAHTLTNQYSLDNISIKDSTLLNSSSSFQSPNTSCSDYQFCPHPITEATDYEYLRHILVKYMTGQETRTLAKVLCSVMQLSRDETDQILHFEQDKH